MTGDILQECDIIRRKRRSFAKSASSKTPLWIAILVGEFPNKNIALCSICGVMMSIQFNYSPHFVKHYRRQQDKNFNEVKNASNNPEHIAIEKLNPFQVMHKMFQAHCYNDYAAFYHFISPTSLAHF